MPECWFYTKLGECTNPECQYLHIDPNSKIKECAWYARGFCKHGMYLMNPLGKVYHFAFWNDAFLGMKKTKH
jgi:hypothetical protein